MCAHVEFWGCGYAVIAAERIATTKSEGEADCVLKETWCKLPVLSRSKEEKIL